MSATRLAQLFADARREGRAVFMPFMTAGLPDADTSVELFEQLAADGADAFEVGIPYSDPLMDGPVIQAASQRVLAGGVTFSVGIDLAGEVARRTDRPVIVMTYVNPILQIGVDAFAGKLADLGVSGVIVADVPLEEALTIQSPLRKAGVGMALFAAPTTSEARLRELAAAEPDFIYAVADLGVTGERTQVSDHLEGLVRRIRGVTSLPVVLGVGISSPDQAAHAARLADGVIVGSALVAEVLASDKAPSAAAFASAIRAGGHA